MSLIIRFLALTAAVYLTVNIVPGVAVTGGWTTMILVALVWSVIVTVIKPILFVLTLPVNIITLGLFTFVINAFLFWAMEFIVPSFSVDGFIPALLGSIALSVISWLILKVLPD